MKAYLTLHSKSCIENNVQSMDLRNKITQDTLEAQFFSYKEGSAVDMLELSDINQTYIMH